MYRSGTQPAPVADEVRFLPASSLTPENAV